MALLKDIETPSGVTANYHRISSAFVNARGAPATAQVVVMSFSTKDAFEAGKSNLNEQAFDLAFDPRASENAHTQCYEALKLLPAFDGATDDI
jgi:hypothetical protein